jgi:hypothetical protein
MQIIRTCEDVKTVISALAGAITLLKTPKLPLSGKTELPLSEEVPERHRQFLEGMTISTTPVQVPGEAEEFEEHSTSTDENEDLNKEVSEMEKQCGDSETPDAEQVGSKLRFFCMSNVRLNMST